MNGTKSGGYVLTFAMSAAVFALCTGMGIFAAYNINGELFESLSGFVKNALTQRQGFKHVLLNAIESDFRYTCTVLVCALGIYTSVIPAAVTGYKGFCAGTAVGIAARVLDRAALIRVSAAVFLSCLFTVSVYIIMFMLGFCRARRNRREERTVGEKVRDYMEFAAAVMIMFTVLCAANCIQAAFEPLIIA